MKRKQPQININLNVDEKTNPEQLKKIYDVLTRQTEEQATPQYSDLYLFNEDIEQLNARYAQLFKEVKSSLDLSEKQIEKECNVLSAKYDFEIKELSKMRELDYDETQAQIAAKRKEQKPWRRSWLWRLLLRPTTNRAQDIIESHAALEADARFNAEEKQLDEFAEKLYGKKSKKKDNSGNVHEQPAVMTNATPAANALAEPTNAPEEPPEPPLRKPRKTT